MTSRARLDDAGIEAALGTLEGWQRDGDAIARSFRFRTFPEAIAFVVAVGDVAETMDHHPDIDIRWRTVTLRASTHDVGGLTGWDVELARRVDALARDRG